MDLANVAISLGDDCAVANIINNVYMPFDWCLTKNLTSIIKIFDDDFKEFTNWNNWYYNNEKIYDKYFKIYDNSDNSDNSYDKIIKTHLLIYTPTHDITVDSAEHDFEEFKVKMERRTSRLRKIPANNRIFYRYESNSIKNITIENVENILKFCKQFKIWLNPNEYNRFIKSPDKRSTKLQKYIDDGKFQIMIDENWRSHRGWKKKLDLF